MFKGISGSLTSLPRRRWLVLILVLASIFVVFLWHLGNLTPGLSQHEVNYVKSSHSWGAIVSDPVNAPHKLIQLGIFKLAPQHPSLLRLASVVFALVFCLAFYWLATSWFGRAIGLFSTLMFACLPLFVVSARQASAAILWFCPIVFLSLYIWLTRTKQYRSAAWFGLLLAASIFLYTPGLLVWIVAAFLICRRPLINAIDQVPAWVSGLGLVCVFSALISIIMASLKHHSLIKQFLLVPANLGSWLEITKNTGWMLMALFVKTGRTDPLIVQRLPILTVLLIALVIFGAYAMWGAARSKAIWLGVAGLYAVLAAGFNNNVEMLALGLAAIGLFVAAGLRYLYIEWRSVFPRNPVPKTFALVLIALVTLVQLYFGLRYALAAWPDAPATRAAYVLK